MWLCALTLVPSEMDILHFLHQKDFHQNSTFLNQKKHQNIKTTHFSPSVSGIFFYVPLGSPSSFPPPCIELGVSVVSGQYLSRWQLRLLLPCLGMWASQGSAAATTCLEKNLGGFKCGMSTFFKKPQALLKICFFLNPNKKGMGPIPKKRSIMPLRMNQPGSQVTTSDDWRSPNLPPRHDRKVGQTFRVEGYRWGWMLIRWVDVVVGRMEGSCWGPIGFKHSVWMPSFGSFFVKCGGEWTFFFEKKIHLMSERAFWNKIVTMFPYLEGAWIVGMDRGETTRWIMCSRTLYWWQFRILAIFHDLSGECEFVKNLHPECLWWLENATCCAPPNRWSKRIDQIRPERYPFADVKTKVLQNL